VSPKNGPLRFWTEMRGYSISNISKRHADIPEGAVLTVNRITSWLITDIRFPQGVLREWPMHHEFGQRRMPLSGTIFTNESADGFGVGKLSGLGHLSRSLNVRHVIMYPCVSHQEPPCHLFGLLLLIITPRSRLRIARLNQSEQSHDVRPRPESAPVLTTARYRKLRLEISSVVSGSRPKHSD
jgi:hypothetical protein